MPSRIISLSRNSYPNFPKPQISFFKGDEVGLKLTGLDSTYQSKTAYLSIKIGKTIDDLTSVTNSLLPFVISGSNTVTLPATITGGEATITLTSIQTAALLTKTNYVLEVQVDLGSGNIDTYGQYDLFVEQDIVANYNWSAIPPGLTSATVLGSNTIDTASNLFFTRALSSNPTFAFSNPVYGRTIFVELTNSVGGLSLTFPAGCTVVSNYDNANGVKNIMTISCTDSATPKYQVVITPAYLLT